MYLKIEAATAADKDLILFYYDRETIFNDVSLMSNYMCKNLTTKEGNSMTDDYAISDDERDLVNVSIRAALPDIYESMAKITNSVSSAFEDDATETGATGRPAAGHYVEFTLLDNGAYNDNVLTTVDASLYNSIKFGTIKEVYSTIVNPDLFRLAADRFVGELFKLKQRLFQLKKKSVLSQLS